MRKVVKYLCIGIALLFAAIIILGSIANIFVTKKQKDYAHSLEGMLAEVNKHLPSKALDGFDYYTMNRVVQEEDNIVWEVILDTTFFCPTYESNLPESLNGSIFPSGNRNMNIDLDTLLSGNLLKQSQQLNLLYYNLFAKTDNSNPLYEEIMNRKCSQTWRIKSPLGDRLCEFTLTYEKMKETEYLCKNQPEMALKLFISEFLQRQNRLLTIASNNADINMQMIDEGEAIVFCCTFEKSYSAGGNKPILNLKRQKEDIQIAIEEDTRTLPIFYDTKSICKKSNKDFIYRFRDWNKKDSIDFIIY